MKLARGLHSPVGQRVVRLVAGERLQVNEELVDVAEVLQHDVELPDDRVPVLGGEHLLPLADDVVQRVVVAF